MTFKKVAENIYSCIDCHDKCDGKSNLLYNFKNDLEFSEHYENRIIDRFNKNPRYEARKSTQSGYPDIEIFKTSTDKPDLYIEVKVQRRTFMTVKKLSQIVFYTHRRQLLLI